MFRRATTHLLSYRRPFSTSDFPSADDLFVAAWKRAMPNLDPPKTPLVFAQPRPSPASDASIHSKLTVNLISAYSSEFSNKEADMIIVPASTGEMGILPGHVSSVSELKPGLLSIHKGNEVTKYFISSGFVYVHSNTVTDVIAVEAVPIEQIDPALVQKGLIEFSEKVSTAWTESEKAEAQIGVDVLSALHSAVSDSTSL